MKHRQKAWHEWEWFDAHLDLACMGVLGRDMRKPPRTAGGPWQPASVTLESLRRGSVTRFLGTIFTEAGGTDAGVSYAEGDAEGARAAGLTQLALYQSWHREGLIGLRGAEGLPEVGAVRAPHCMLLMECADPIRSPEELRWWVQHGVVAIGLAWARGSRYASGNTADPALKQGLTGLGRSLVAAMDELGVVHDASHLSDRALMELFAATNKPVIASHSNSRAIVAREPVAAESIPESLRGHPHGGAIAMQRHLTDDAMREIARRGGVIGLNLYSPFLIPGASRDRRATIDEAVAHVDHVCEVVGHTRAVGLGSDMDGGFSGAMLPEGIDEPKDMVKLLEALAALGWSDEDLAGFVGGNWARFFDGVGFVRS